MLKLTINRHKASRGICATAELLVCVLVKYRFRENWKTVGGTTIWKKIDDIQRQPDHLYYKLRWLQAAAELKKQQQNILDVRRPRIFISAWPKSLTSVHSFTKYCVHNTGNRWTQQTDGSAENMKPQTSLDWWRHKYKTKKNVTITVQGYRQ